MKDVVIVSGVRLPVGSYGGSLKDITAIDMGAMVVKEAVKRAGIQPSDVDEVVIGQVGEVAENGFIARAVSLNRLFCKPSVWLRASVHCRSCDGDSDRTGGRCCCWWYREYFKTSVLCKRCTMGSKNGSQSI